MDQRFFSCNTESSTSMPTAVGAQLVEEQAHDDVAAHDPERIWALRRIFRCTTCGDTVTFDPGDGAAPPDAE